MFQKLVFLQSLIQDPALPQKPAGRFEWGALLALLLLAFGLRMVNLGATSLWIDEIYSMVVANGHFPPAVIDGQVRTAAWYYEQYLAWQPLDFEVLLELLRVNVHMPLYYILLNPWLGFFGNDGVILRSFSALFSTLMLLPIYFLGKALGGQRAGLISVLVGALLPFQLYFAQEGRMYALALFWACCSAFAFWKTLFAERRPLQWAMLHAVTTALGMLTHYMFAFFLAFQVLYGLMWLFGRRDLKRFSLFGLTAVALAAVAVAWMPVFQAQRTLVSEEYHFAKGMVGWLRYPTQFVWQPLVMVAGDNRLMRVFYFPLTVLLFLFYLFKHQWQRDRSERREQFLFEREGFLLFWLLVPLLVQVAYDIVNQSHTVVVDRYVLLISPAMILWLGLGLERLMARGWVRPVLGVLTAMLLLAVMAVWWPSPFRDEHNKKDTQGRIAYMLSQAQPTDLVFVNGPYGAPVLAAYYLYPARPDQPILYWMSPYRGEPVPLPLSEALVPYDRVWLFLYRANNERGLRQVMDYLDTLYPNRVQRREWFIYER